MRKFLENASGVYQIELAGDRGLKNAYKAYQSSIESELLKGEENRGLFPEILRTQESKPEAAEEPPETIQKPIQTDDADSSDEELIFQQMASEKKNWYMELTDEVRSNFPKRLCELALEELARDYQRGPINPLIAGEHFVKFGELLDVELPVLDLLDLEVSLNES
jgi:hypothetical protein